RSDERELALWAASEGAHQASGRAGQDGIARSDGTARDEWELTEIPAECGTARVVDARNRSVPERGLSQRDRPDRAATHEADVRAVADNAIDPVGVSREAELGPCDRRDLAPELERGHAEERKGGDQHRRRRRKPPRGREEVDESQ